MMASNFNKFLKEYILENTLSKGRYNLIGVPLEYVSKMTSTLGDSITFNYKGDSIKVPAIRHDDSRKIPIVYKKLTSSEDENELAMNVRNNEQVFSDYIFASESEVSLASGENTISIFPNNWNNHKNEFLLFIRSKQKNKVRQPFSKACNSLIKQGENKALWEKVYMFCDCINIEAIEKTLGYTKGQIEKGDFTNNRSVVNDLFKFLVDSSEKDSLFYAKSRLIDAISDLTIKPAAKSNIIRAFEAFFNYLMDILTKNSLSLNSIVLSPNYYYSPESNLFVDPVIKQEWSDLWHLITFDKLKELLDSIGAKVSTGTAGVKFKISIENRIKSKIIHPDNNRSFNYTVNNTHFRSNDNIHYIKTGRKQKNIAPTTDYIHVEGNTINKNLSLKFINSSNQESMIWRFVQLDQFEPGIGIGFSNIKKYDLNSYPKKVINNIWRAKFQLQSKNSDSLEIINNKDTEIKSVHAVAFDAAAADYDGMNETQIFENIICPNKSVNSEELIIQSQESFELYNSYTYGNPVSFIDLQHEYFIVIKTYNNLTKMDYCVISQLEFDTNEQENVSSYFEKYLKECIVTDSNEYVVESDEYTSIIDKIEEHIISNKVDSSHIICFDTEIGNNWFNKCIKNQDNIDRNIFSDFVIKSNFDDFRPKLNLPVYFENVRQELFDFLNKISNGKCNLSQIDLTEEKVVSLIKKYGDSFLKWVRSGDTNAYWLDLIIFCESDRSNSLMKSKPVACLTPSFHPLKLLQLVESQISMKDALNSDMSGAPGAGLLDLTLTPSNLSLSYGANGSNRFSFYAIGNDNQYMSFLLNQDQLSADFIKINYDLLKNPRLFNIRLFDSSNSISEKQVHKAIDDVTNIYIAKTNLKISANDFGTDVVSGFSKGVYSWVDENLTQKSSSIHSEKRISVFDQRTNENEHPESAELRSLCNSSNGKLEWYNNKNTEKNDLNVICNLPKDQFEVKICDSSLELYNPIFSNYRFPNLENYNIDLSPKIASGIVAPRNSDKTLESLIYLFENITNAVAKIESQSNLNQIQNGLNLNKFTAISGIDLAPSSFDNISSDYLLYDYNTVDYVSDFGPINRYGYFLISNDQKFIKSSINHAINRNFNTSFVNSEIDALLTRVSKNGVSNLKAIYAGGNHTRGELGVFVADYILKNVKADNVDIISFVVPVDPFLPKITSLMKFINKSGDVKTRPDFLYFSICKESCAMRLTPIEVKFRDRIIDKEMKSAMDQADGFCLFIKKLLAQELDLWKVTTLDFILMLCSYGLNQLISKESQIDKSRDLINFRSKVTNTLFENAKDNSLSRLVNINERGRVIAVSPSASKTEFISSNSSGNKYTRINVDEDFAIKCLKNQNIDEIKHEWFRLNNNSSSFFDLEIECKGTSEYNSDFLDQLDEKNKLSQTIIKNENIHGASDDDIADKEVVETAPILANDEVNVHSDPINFNTNDICGVEIPLGRALNLTDQTDYLFTPSDTQLNQLNIGVVGDLGTGKTQFLKNFIYKISLAHSENRGEAPKFLIFDTKKDYDLTNNSKIDKILHEKANIRTFSPSFLPINIFDLSNVVGANKAHVRAKFISNIFNKIFRIGIVQESKLTKIISDCYRSKGYKPGMSIEDITGLETPNFKEIHDLYDKDDSVKAILFDIVESYIFESDKTKIMSFKDLFQQSLVFSLGDLVENQRELVMIVLLVLYREYMIGIKKEPFIESSKNGKTLRKVDSFVLIDEANQIMDYEFDVLEDILLKGREFGVGVILSTQYLSHFKKSNMNYAESLNTWFVHKQNKLNKRDLLDIGLQNADENRISKIKRLRVFECLYKSLNSDDGVFIKGIPFFENFE